MKINKYFDEVRKKRLPCKRTASVFACVMVRYVTLLYYEFQDIVARVGFYFCKIYALGK